MTVDSTPMTTAGSIILRRARPSQGCDRPMCCSSVKLIAAASGTSKATRCERTLPCTWRDRTSRRCRCAGDGRSPQVRVGSRWRRNSGANSAVIRHGPAIHRQTEVKVMATRMR